MSFHNQIRLCLFGMGGVHSNLNCCFMCKRKQPLTEEPFKTDESSTPKIYSWDSRPRIQNHRIENLCNTEIIRQSGTINGEQMIIENCKNCKIYLLDHQAALNIDDCEGCIIVSGPISGSIFLRDSKNLTLCSASGQLRLRDCNSIHLFCSSESEPIIENCEDINIALYSLSYKDISDHFRATSLCPEKLISNSIYDFTPPMNDALSNWKSIQGEDPLRYISPPNCQPQIEFSLNEFHSFTPTLIPQQQQSYIIQS